MNQEKEPLLTSITLGRFLSFGASSVEVSLKNLNVIIGPNGSGKSNFIEAISVLQAAPHDLLLPIRQGGGIHNYLWNGSNPLNSAVIEAVFHNRYNARGSQKDIPIKYRLELGVQGDSCVVLDEQIENKEPYQGHAKPYFYFHYDNGRPVFNVYDIGSSGGSGDMKTEPSTGRVERQLRREDIDTTQSILSQRHDPEHYPEVSRLATLLRKILIYRTWSFGLNSPLRMSCPSDVRTDHLSENFSNLPARLSVMKRDPATKKKIITLLRELTPGFDDIEIIPEGGQLQLYLSENDRMLPARRLSDGTLHFLSLLAILLDPTPPPLIVIEEPELGLHPDTLMVLRDLMVEASKRCQLIITTHSTLLVDAMTDDADSVLICDKQEGATTLTRLSQDQINEWKKEDNRLGDLWMSGHIGGTRW